MKQHRIVKDSIGAKTRAMGLTGENGRPCGEVHDHLAESYRYIWHGQSLVAGVLTTVFVFDILYLFGLMDDPMLVWLGDQYY